MHIFQTECYEQNEEKVYWYDQPNLDTRKMGAKPLNEYQNVDWRSFLIILEL